MKKKQTKKTRIKQFFLGRLAFGSGKRVLMKSLAGPEEGASGCTSRNASHDPKGTCCLHGNPGCGPQLAPGSSHQSWDLGIHSYGRRAAAGPRCACWTQTSKRCHALPLHTREARGRTQGPRLAQRCDKPRCLSADRAEATRCGPRRHAPPAYTRPVLACTQSSAGFPSPAVQEGGCWAPIAAGW